jgi:hypothetical protein
LLKGFLAKDLLSVSSIDYIHEFIFMNLALYLIIVNFSFNVSFTISTGVFAIPDWTEKGLKNP